MKKVIAVIRREFVARVRTKAFVISTILLPVMIVFFAVVPALLMSGSNETRRIAVVDASGSGLGQQVSSTLGAQKLDDKSGAAASYTLKVFPANSDNLASVRDGLIAKTGFSKNNPNNQWDGVMVLSDKALSTGKVNYYGNNVGSMDAMRRLQRSVSQVLSTARLADSRVDPKLVAKAMQPADLDTTKVQDGKTTGQSGVASFMLAYVMGFILYIAILMYGQQTMASVIEEKTSRIMEVLASSLTPFQMLLGKVLGVGAAGLLQMVIWGGSVYVVTSQRVFLAGLFGISPAAMQSFPIPVMSGSLLLVFLAYFALGFLLYGALYAAIGAMCNTVQETQQYGVIVTMLIMVGFFAVFALINDPTGSIGVTMSYIPFFAPFVMPVR